jgi:hypothetical protein
VAAAAREVERAAEIERGHKDAEEAALAAVVLAEEREERLVAMHEQVRDAEGNLRTCKREERAVEVALGAAERKLGDLRVATCGGGGCLTEAGAQSTESLENLKAAKVAAEGRILELKGQVEALASGLEVSSLDLADEIGHYILGMSSDVWVPHCG